MEIHLTACIPACGNARGKVAGCGVGGLRVSKKIVLAVHNHRYTERRKYDLIANSSVLLPLLTVGRGRTNNNLEQNNFLKGSKN